MVKFYAACSVEFKARGPAADKPMVRTPHGAAVRKVI